MVQIGSRNPENSGGTSFSNSTEWPNVDDFLARMRSNVSTPRVLEEVAKSQLPINAAAFRRQDRP